MESSCHNKQSISFSLSVLFFLFSFFITKAQALGKLQRPWNNTASAIFVFGDSTVDPGNNNYVATAFKGNFLPYGENFKNNEPTGRFSNGRLTTDFIASYVGIKEYIPPYLDPTLSTEELMTGVSFASAGSGFDPLTPMISNVIGIPQQVEYFKEYKKRIESAIGKKRMENHIKKALFIISAGTNDFVVNYFNLPFRRRTYSIPQYQQFLLQKFKQLMQELWDEGARRFTMSGLPPMGCLPVVITLNSVDAVGSRGCIQMYSSVATQFNFILQAELNSMQMSLAPHGSRIFYVDTYSALLHIILENSKFGFEEVNHGCCGTGLLEAGIFCNPKTYVCPDATKYVFFDSIHPTEKTYSIVFDSIRPIIDALIRD